MSEPREDDAELLAWMPAEQVPLYLTAVAAIKALQAARKESGLETVWWLYAAPMRLTRASYQDFYGTKEVWTVNLEHPAHAEGQRRRAERRKR